MIEKVYEGEELVAICIGSDKEIAATEFFTPFQMSQQLGIVSHRAGDIIEPHTHNRVSLAIDEITEILIVRKGAAEISLFKADYSPLYKRVIREGDIIWIRMVIHSLKFLTDTQLIEIKQGPYHGGEEKQIHPILSVKNTLPTK